MEDTVTKIFKEGDITLETKVYDPRLVSNLPVKTLKKNFEEWLYPTPEYWYENIKEFEDWVDSIWDWLDDQD